MKVRGFSLAETMFALGLLGLVVVLILNIFPSSMATVRSAEQRSHAESVANSKLEEQVEVPFDQLPLGLDKDLGSQNFLQVDYHARLQVLKADGDPRYLRAVRVNVDWTVRGLRRQVVRELLIHRLSHDT